MFLEDRLQPICLLNIYWDGLWIDEHMSHMISNVIWELKLYGFLVLHTELTDKVSIDFSIGIIRTLLLNCLLHMLLIMNMCKGFFIEYNFTTRTLTIAVISHRQVAATVTRCPMTTTSGTALLTTRSWPCMSAPWPALTTLTASPSISGMYILLPILCLYFMKLFAFIR